MKPRRPPRHSTALAAGTNAPAPHPAAKELPKKINRDDQGVRTRVWYHKATWPLPGKPARCCFLSQVWALLGSRAVADDRQADPTQYLPHHVDPTHVVRRWACVTHGIEADPGHVTSPNCRHFFCWGRLPPRPLPSAPPPPPSGPDHEQRRSAEVWQHRGTGPTGGRHSKGHQVL